ncbi:MAG TPA: recombination mediator RecR [Phycisphaerales bacterium]|nr:recombination mediator RecR [Phycisphaerales bacterium]
MAKRTTGSTPYPTPVEKLIDELSRLPGIGRRSAERMAFYLLKSPPEVANALSRAVSDLKSQIRICSICYNLADSDPCRLCADPQRDASTILVVEQARDLLSLEQTGLYKGVYHVLTGAIDPLAGVEPSDLTIARLLERIDKPETNSRQTAVKEVILGLNPNLEGDTTGLYLAQELATRQVSLTRLARGLPAGSQLEYANRAVLADAIHGRQPMAQE